MSLGFIDWLAISLFVPVILLISIRYSRSSSRSISDFFLGGRKLPWYVAGISMLASTFAIGGPPLITEYVYRHGVSGNWIWWSMLIGGTFTAIFLAGLWRRAGILTEVEFTELRYSGRSARFLRIFKSLYFGLFLNVMTIAWISIAMKSILGIVFGIPDSQQYIFIIAAMTIAATCSVLGGLKGIAWINLLQFVITLAGSIVLSAAIVSSYKISGITGLKMQLNDISGDYLNFFPKLHSSAQLSAKILPFSITTLLALVGIQWWTSWSPSYDPGGGGSVAQRMMSVKSEKESIMAALLSQVINYAIRPWPWIIISLCTVVLLPRTHGTEQGTACYNVIKDYMPYGTTGFLMVSFLGIYISILSVHLNTGASFLVNDLYKRFVAREEKFKNTGIKERHYVLMGKLMTIILMCIALYITTFFGSLGRLWEFMLACFSGYGLVLILRWFWWRINAWSEITAATVPFIIVYITNVYFKTEFPDGLYLVAGGTTAAWIIVTLLTSPVNSGVLKEFCMKINPAGFWGRFSQYIKKYPDRYILALFMSWLSSVIMIYSLLFFTGKLLFKEYISAFGWLLSAIIYFAFLRGAMKVIVRGNNSIHRYKQTIGD
jgi:SSS family solute:Na+ symporter